MWRCLACGRTFANCNHAHACAEPGDLDRHFEHASPEVRATFDTVLAAVSMLGPVQVLAEKTRIALHVRMSFAAFMPRRRWLAGHLVLARRIDSARFVRIDELSARNVVHAFRLASPEEVDEQFTAGSPRHTPSALNGICGADPTPAA